MTNYQAVQTNSEKSDVPFLGHLCFVEFHFWTIRVSFFAYVADISIFVSFLFLMKIKPSIDISRDYEFN